MPYKIYTYEDPYQLDQTDFWDEIKALPHFCVSRTLVNGFIDVMQCSIEGLICPFEDIVSSEEVYKGWTKNIGLRLKQYSALTTIFKERFTSGEIGPAFHAALMKNQNQFLDSIRLFIELGIQASALDVQKANKEQRLFISILNDIQNVSDSIFNFPSTPNRIDLKKIFVDIAKKELDAFEKKIDGRRTEHVENKRQWFHRAIENTEKKELDAIVIHGVHQFSPAQLRLLIDMDKMGLTIIFIFNYQKRFPKLYSSWKYIYQCFNVPIHHDTNITEYHLPLMQNPSNALAMALGELCEGNYKRGDKRFIDWYELYGNAGIREFANITEYAHFISEHFDQAIRNYYEDLSIIDRGNRVLKKSAVLRYLNEQVYTANRDVHSLLRIYYPEYSKDRHFLAYPIGQFFSAIYRLWNWERGEINFDEKAVKECISSGILSSGKAEELLRTFCTIQIALDNVSSFSEFETNIKGRYLEQYDLITKAKGTDVVAPLKQLSIYSTYKVKRSDITTLVKAIEELNSIAVNLFSPENESSREDFITFGKHFQNLEQFIKQRQPDLANEEERVLITALLLRFDNIKSISDHGGTFRDLREGLYFYLKQKDDDDGVDWIVKNFEQIDGDILQSKSQFEKGETKVYHFACVSDRDLSFPIDDLLPWPLSDFFIRKAYSPSDLQFQVYYASKSERGNFLRYALFYGLCFNRCDMRLSYVKEYGDETTEPYTLLSILGLRPDLSHVETAAEAPDIGLKIRPTRAPSIRYDKYEMMSMFLCPYRYFHEYVLSNSPIIHGDFLYRKFFENLLVEAVWKRIAGQPKQVAISALERILSSELESVSLKHFFPFWKHTEIYDLKLRAKNYMIYRIINVSGAFISPFNETHMKIRRLFGNAKFIINISDSEPKNPFSVFEQLAVKNYPKKTYSLHSLPKLDQHAGTNEKTELLSKATLEYLTQTESVAKTAVASEWCDFCTNRGVCLEPFLMNK